MTTVQIKYINTEAKQPECHNYKKMERSTVQQTESTVQYREAKLMT